MSYGTNWGSLWGGGTTSTGEFTINSLLSINSRLVRIVFSQDLYPNFAPHASLANYGIVPSLAVKHVILSGNQPNVITLVTEEQGAELYTLTINQALSATDIFLPNEERVVSFLGYAAYPSFNAAAQSSRKVVLEFSAAMLVNEELGNPLNYTVTDLNGVTNRVLSATWSGPEPVTRVTLLLEDSLKSSNNYLVQVSQEISTEEGLTFILDTDMFRWLEQGSAILRGEPLEIPISRFSGEVRGGLLGQPAGQVFFSPALEAAVADSVLEIDEVEVCTQATDVYEIPDTLSPSQNIPLHTFGGGIAPTLIGQNYLWASSHKLGRATLNLSESNEDNAPQGTDVSVEATLSETIDITKASFLNDPRWRTFPGGGEIVFTTADNLAPIGPGPSVVIQIL